MLTTLLLAAVLPGQSCAVGAYATRGTATYNYAAQPYAATTYYYPIKARVDTALIATELYEPVYGVLASSGLRAENRRAEDRAVVAELAKQVGLLTAAVGGLQVSVQPAPVPPGKPLPTLPPVPKPNPPPDDGSVPPPPTPDVPNPGPAAAGGLFQRSAPVIQGKCFACHSAKEAEKSGGNYVMEAPDGSVRGGFSPQEKLELLRRITIGNMPKLGPPLTPDEKAPFQIDVMTDPAVKAFLTAATK